MYSDLTNKLKEEELSNRENFNRLVTAGYRLIKLTSNLTPMSSGWNDSGFIYETEFQEDSNYGIVGGSEHVCVNEEKGKLIFIDFDPKEKTKDDIGNTHYIIHDDAVAELESVLVSLDQYPLYQDRTKNKGAHIGIITNEKIAQSVNNYQSQNCDKLHVDIRTELGYIVAIAPGYSIEKIPEMFTSPIENFESFMFGLDFKMVNKITINDRKAHHGSLSDIFKTKCRKMIKNMDVSEFPEFGTVAVGTHDVISFLVMSQRSTQVPEEEAVEKIMELLSRINTTKDNQLTENEIHKMYNKDYDGFRKESSELEIDESKRLEREAKETPLQQIERYLNTQVKNDPKIVSQMLRVCLSTYTNDPINAALLAPSSDGKTYVTVKVTDIFPDGDVITVGRMSPTALIHAHGILIDSEGNPLQERIDELNDHIDEAADNKKLKKALEKQKKILLADARNCVDLQNKILLFLDNPSPATYEMLKPIMSHDKREIIYKTTKGDGSLTVKETIIRNWPVFIFCSAKNEDKNEVWEEIKTRVLMTSPDSSVTKYKEANRYTALKMGLPSWASSVYHNDEDRKWAKWHVIEFKKNLNELCSDANNPVLNLLHSRLADVFPSSQGDYMRHFKRLQSFIKLETMLNFEKRPVYELGANSAIVTTIDDVDEACKTLGDISCIPPEKIKFYKEVFCPLFERKSLGSADTLDGTWLTSVELVEEYTRKLGKTTDSKKILENYLKPLTDAGVLEYDQNPNMKQQNMYRKNGKVSVQNIAELKSKTIEDSKTVESGMRSCLESVAKSSTENGISKEKITLNNQIITLEQLIQIISGNPSKTEEV